MPVVKAIQITEAEARYLDACARIRCISRARLVARLIRAIAKDQMVLGVLDDDSRPQPYIKGEKRQKRPDRSVAADARGRPIVRAA